MTRDAVAKSALGALPCSGWCRSAPMLVKLALGERFSVTRDDECALTTPSGRWTKRHTNDGFQGTTAIYWGHWPAAALCKSWICWVRANLSRLLKYMSAEAAFL
jgi:hypothetical protein